VVDAPPGTSDEHISIAQFLQASSGGRGSGGAEGAPGPGVAPSGLDGAIIVTTPQEVSIIDVRKEISFCRKVGSCGRRAA